MLKKRLYLKVFNKLMKFFKHCLKRKPIGHLLKRIRSLAAYISGMIRNKSSHLSALGKGLLQLIKGHSQVKAAKKFLYNKFISYKEYYLPYLKEFIKLLLPILPSQDTIELVIDGSKMGKHHAILMVSLVYGKRSIPIGWLVKKGAKGHFSKANHVELVKQVQADLTGVFPCDRTIILLGDGEFGSIELQECCLSANWSYVFRIACSTKFYKDGETFKSKELGVPTIEDYAIMTQIEQGATSDLFPQIADWELPQDLQLAPNQDHIFVSDIEYTKKRF